jgi:hypothetical protein
MQTRMIRRLHRLVSGFGYNQEVKDILFDKTIFVDQAHPLIPDFNLCDPRNLWTSSDFICVYLRSSAVSSVFAFIRVHSRLGFIFSVTSW